MARVLRDFPVPEDPLKPKGSLRRAWWRTIKESLAGSGMRLGARPIIVGGLAMMIYHWGLPHVLFNYRVAGAGTSGIYYGCEYIGLKPFIVNRGACPVIRWVPWKELKR